jgi:hypothetical protein
LRDRVQPCTVLEALLKALGDYIDGKQNIESDPKQDRDNNYGVDYHYALPLFLVELGVMRLQICRQQTQNDNVSDEKEEEDQGIVDLLKFYPVL